MTDWERAARRGDHEACWAIADAVLRARDLAESDNPAVPYHQRWVWDGRALAGRRVLVRCYHGLGDTLHYARYLAPLRARAAWVTLEVQPAMLALCGGLAGADRVVGFDPAHPLVAEPDTVAIEIMELAHALRLPPACVPPPYLSAPAAAMVPADAVGWCWQAGGWDPDRRVPFALLAPLVRRRPAVSLVPGAAPAGAAWLNPDGSPEGIEQLAAVITGLASVVTTDTMVAHLTGALGRPGFLLLRYQPDWRWGDSGTSSAWYPSLTLYRQTALGDWTAPLERLAAVLGC